MPPHVNRDLTRFNIRNKANHQPLDSKQRKIRSLSYNGPEISPIRYDAPPPNQTPIKNRLARPSPFTPPTDHQCIDLSLPESTVIALRQSNIPNGFRSLWTQDLYLPSAPFARRPASSSFTAGCDLLPQSTNQWKRMGILHVRVGNPHQNNYNTCYRSRHDPLTIPMWSL